MKKYIVLLVLPFILHCTNRPEDFIKYSTNNFSIYYPQDWTKQECKNNVAVIFTSPQNINYIDKIKPHTTITFSKNKKDKPLIEKAIETIKNSITSFNKLKLEHSYFANHDGQLTFSGEILNKNVIWILTVFEGETDYFISSMCEECDFKMHQKTFKKIANSFKVK